ncbi:MAG: PhzF family phenazine biosynthesis protein [Silicimonas sp.]|nr:PhzF family phenazine biosynthesis protein [Silicimonas sp.]
MTDFLVYDVFTDKAFGGNPLAVIPDATRIAETDLQRVAREFNFSETTFVFPPEVGGDAKVRIFTPTSELQFAGHPTVGTAVALSDLGRAGPEMVLELGVGPIPVTVSGRHARFETRVPLSVSEAPGIDAVGAMIGQSGSAIRIDRHSPITAGLGTGYVLAELTDEAALTAARPVADAFLDAGGADAKRLALLVYLRDGNRIRARMFAPLGGIPEDPATGSAVAALAAWLGRQEGRSARFDVLQGVEMGRPSRIAAEVTVEDGEPVVVAIAGDAVKMMEGRLVL